MLFSIGIVPRGRHLRRDFLKPKNEKGKETRVDVMNDVVTITCILLIISCLSPKIGHLMCGLWLLVVHFMLRQTRTSLLLISARIMVEHSWGTTLGAML